jgi:hypothetical protein
MEIWDQDKAKLVLEWFISLIGGNTKFIDRDICAGDAT